jgi:hypothetical protein
MTLRTLSLVLLTGIITVQVTYQNLVGPTTLETPIFSLVGLNTAAVEFDQAYNLHAGDICKLELIRWRATYTVVLQDLIGTSHMHFLGDSHGAPVLTPI